MTGLTRCQGKYRLTQVDTAARTMGPARRYHRPSTARNTAIELPSEESMTSTAHTIRLYISEELAPGSDIDDDTSLITSEIIDSMGVLTLIGFLEEEFGVEINADDVDLSHFENVAGISRLVEDRRDRT